MQKNLIYLDSSWIYKHDIVCTRLHRWSNAIFCGDNMLVTDCWAFLHINIWPCKWLTKAFRLNQYHWWDKLILVLMNASWWSKLFCEFSVFRAKSCAFDLGCSRLSEELNCKKRPRRGRRESGVETSQRLKFRKNTKCCVNVRALLTRWTD